MLDKQIIALLLHSENSRAAKVELCRAKAERHAKATGLMSNVMLLLELSK